MRAKCLADGKSFPFAYGMTRADADRIGAWWEDRRGIVQPSEFILDGEALGTGSKCPATATAPSAAWTPPTR